MKTENHNEQPLNLSIVVKGEKWEAISLMPTDRYYITFNYEDGLDYELADAVVMLAKADTNRTMVKAIGINYGMANYFDVYWLEETFDLMLLDILEMDQLESMIAYKVDADDVTREQALRIIKRDFMASKVRLSAEVMEAFDQVK